MTITVRRATSRDLVAVCAIEAESFSDPWTRSMFTAHLVAATDTFLVAEVDGAIAGYALVRVVESEGEVMNIAVSGASRRVGIGARLLDAGIGETRAGGASEVWLEVRESNAAARALYESRGFVAVGRRKRYYESPREDALVMRARLQGAGSELVPQADAGLPGASAERILSPASQLPRQEIR